MLMYESLGILFGVLSLTGFGISDFFTAKSARKIGPLKTILWFQVLLLLMILALSPFLFKWPVITLYDAILIGVSVIASIAGMLSFSKGMQVGNVSLVATVGNAWGAITAVLGFVFFAEAISVDNMLALGAIVVGTILVSMNLAEVKTASRKLEKGMGYAIFTAFALGLFFFLDGILANNLGWFAAALLLSIPTVLVLLAYSKASGTNVRVGWNVAPLLLIVALPNLIGFLGYNIGVTFGYIDIVAPVSGAAPVVTVIMALVLLKEKLALNQKLGILLVILGIVWLSF